MDKELADAYEELTDGEQEYEDGLKEIADGWVQIDIGKGVCGAAARLNKTQLVANVHEFPGHIACDCASNSEIVIPLHRDGRVFGVLDIDSPLFGRFTEEDRIGLESAAIALEKELSQIG